MKVIIATDEESFRILATALLTGQPIKYDNPEGIALPNDDLLLALIKKMTQEHFESIRRNSPLSSNESFLSLLRGLRNIVIAQKEYLPLPQSERNLQEDINTFWTPMH